MLELIPLCTAVVDVAPSLSVGAGPAGRRTVGHIHAVTLEGERIRATLACPAAADWMVLNGSVGVIDVRMTVRTEDGAVIHITYGGRLDLANRRQRDLRLCRACVRDGRRALCLAQRRAGGGKGKLTIGEGGATRIDYEFCQVR